MKSAFQISDRIAMVHGGRIIYQGSTHEFRAAKDPRISDFIEGRAPINEDVETLLKA
jgi:phospholipid/cholesterol/gamma-HCH transport system ATP-binding protein